MEKGTLLTFKIAAWMIKNFSTKGYGMLRWGLFKLCESCPRFYQEKMFQKSPWNYKIHIQPPTSGAPIKREWTYYKSSIPHFCHIISCLSESILAFKMNISSPFHTWRSIVDARHNVKMTHHGGTDTIREGMERGSGKYSISLGRSRRQSRT